MSPRRHPLLRLVRSSDRVPEVERLAKARGYTVVRVYEELGSAAKYRPEYEATRNDAKNGKFDTPSDLSARPIRTSMVGDVIQLDRIGVKLPWHARAG
jgi:hypothetical protein